MAASIWIGYIRQTENEMTLTRREALQGVVGAAAATMLPLGAAGERNEKGYKDALA